MPTEWAKPLGLSLLHVAFFIPSFGDGGVERNFVNTACGLADRGCRVDFITNRFDGAYLAALRPAITCVELNGEATDDASYRRFMDYLRTYRPDVLISGKDHANHTALAAGSATAVSTKLVMYLGTVVSASQYWSPFGQRQRKVREVQATYPQADGLIAVSDGVARDTARIIGCPRDHIRTIRSSVITPEFFDQLQAPIEHPWLIDKPVPVVIAMGRLARVKNFDDLLRAFARLRRRRPLRLIIAGQGRMRRVLERQARRLNIAADVDLIGFVANPYPLLAAADLFVLSSRYEGLGNVLVEAVAAGLPVVATDCPVGPREVLADNRWSRLVPVGNRQALAHAMNEALDWPRPPMDELRATVRDYTMEASAAHHEAVLREIVHGA